MESYLSPYLAFNGNARAAMEFYHGIFGGTLDITTFKDYQMSKNPADDDKIMHSELLTPGGLRLMGSDVTSDITLSTGSAISLSLMGDNAAELTAWFNGLAVGGTITEPLVAAPWGDTFGMVRDKFGIDWMVNISPV